MRNATRRLMYRFHLSSTFIYVYEKWIMIDTLITCDPRLISWTSRTYRVKSSHGSHSEPFQFLRSLKLLGTLPTQIYAKTTESSPNYKELYEKMRSHYEALRKQVQRMREEHEELMESLSPDYSQHSIPRYQQQPIPSAASGVNAVLFGSDVAAEEPAIAELMSSEGWRCSEEAEVDVTLELFCFDFNPRINAGMQSKIDTRINPRIIARIRHNFVQVQLTIITNNDAFDVNDFYTKHTFHSRLLRGHTLLATPPELDIFFRTRCLVPSCECCSRFCRRWQVPSLLCRLHLVSVVHASGATL
ncbi:unnamed protein product [Trichogramma brassicae]|uniref:Uncharacterized protein n=1 Tax=Trichogramma brassicae TaxID=86971 RepID=A0A6H5INM6_9HYME|nr:unnamed protein product [Trichogramma brassicae]